jgi:hypothetical protein
MSDLEFGFEIGRQAARLGDRTLEVLTRLAASVGRPLSPAVRKLLAGHVASLRVSA